MSDHFRGVVEEKNIGWKPMPRAGRPCYWGRVIVCALMLLVSVTSFAEERVQRFKPPEFRSGYTVPPTKTPVLPDPHHGVVDLCVLAGALGLAAYLILKQRSRKLTFLLTIVIGVGYFGFYKKGCVCPVGSIQNVALAAGQSAYVLPWTIAAVFVLPLLASLFFGRVFCSGVCPLGAIQDLVLFKPVRIPPWVEMPLGLIAFAYLGLGVLFAATGSDFFICRYDPFVGLYRLSGPSHMIVAGLVILAMCLFIGRVYCRFLCPYSVLLRMMAVFAVRRVTITPAQCVDCRLCEESCPFGAIRYPAPNETARDVAGQRRELAWALGALPVVIGLCALLGYLGSGALSRMDFTVQLAEKVLAEEQTGVRKTSHETRAFWDSGVTARQLYSSAADLQRRFAIGAPLFGAWMGMAIGGRVIGLLIRRRKSGYTADAGSCVACARCYAHCPVENDVRQRQRDQEMVTV